MVINYPEGKGWAADIPAPYDPAKAEALLAEAGAVKDGGTWMLDGAPLEIHIVTYSSPAALPPTAELTQAFLAAIGVKANITVGEWGESNDAIAAGEAERMTLNVTGLSAIRAGRTILHSTSLEFPRRGRSGLVGVSGSGKSTLGHALIDDLRAQGHNVAHVPQSPEEALDPLRSIAFHWRKAEVALGLAPGVADQAGLFRALKIEGGDLRKRPWDWSRGMQQRFVIVMALVGSPDLIVLDEPTSALDPVVAAATMELFSGFLDGKDTAMILVTHDLGLAARRVESLMVTDAGRLVEKGRTEDILEHPKTEAPKSLSAHRNWMALPC